MRPLKAVVAAKHIKYFLIVGYCFYFVVLKDFTKAEKSFFFFYKYFIFGIKYSQINLVGFFVSLTN